MQKTSDKVDKIAPSINFTIHRNEEYDETQFELLRKMQSDHFWYRGRHNFILSSMNRFISIKDSRSAVDFGGGVGGWLNFLIKNTAFAKSIDLTLADSSLAALTGASVILPKSVHRMQIDLMNVKVDRQWDLAFLLDVIEHLSDDLHVLSEIRPTLSDKGFLFITAPAFQKFWSYNDDLSKHKRRYSKADFVQLAKDSGFKLCDSRYFMFFLSPFYLISRHGFRVSKKNQEEIRALMVRQHSIPPKILNEILASIFVSESYLGNRVQFPWGTSILGVFQKI
jgi:SAM-dependent methyltransferase